MSWAERRQREREATQAAQAKREASVLRRVQAARRHGVALEELHDRLVLASALTAGATLDVTRRSLINLAERGEVHVRDGLWWPGPGPTPPQGSRVGAPAPGGGERTSSPTPGATAGPKPSAVAVSQTPGSASHSLSQLTTGEAAVGAESEEATAACHAPTVPSETVQRAPEPAGPAGAVEGTAREVRPTSLPAPTAGDTPPSSGEQDAAQASEACIPAAAPAGETEGVCAPAVAAPSEPAPTSPPEPTVSAYRHRVDATAVESYVRAHPGCGFREIARSLECSDTHVIDVARGRKGYPRPQLREERPRPGRTAPVRLYPISSPPSPTSPPGEVATASGGELVDTTPLHPASPPAAEATPSSIPEPRPVAPDAFTEAADEIARICGCPTWDYPGQLVRDVRGLADERDALRLDRDTKVAALRQRIQQLERDVAGLADLGLERNALQAQVAELQREGREVDNRAAAAERRVLSLEHELRVRTEERDGLRHDVESLQAQVAELPAVLGRETVSLRAQHEAWRRHNDAIATFLGAEPGQDDEVLRIAAAIHRAAQGEHGDDAAEVLRSAIKGREDARQDRDTALEDLARVLGEDVSAPIVPREVDAARRRLREPLEAALGGGEIVRALTLPALADEVERVVATLRSAQQQTRYVVGVDSGRDDAGDLLDELRDRASASGLRVPTKGGRAAVVAYLMGWLEAGGVITAPSPVEVPCGS